MTRQQNHIKSIVLLFLTVFGVLYFRRTDAFNHPKLWAEDGSIFLQQYAQFGIGTLLIPYAGYFHTLPRLIALFWGTLGMNYLYIPICYNYTAFVITLLMVFHLWKSANYLKLENKMTYAVAFLFLPIHPDVFMNVTNLNTIAALYLVDILFIGRTEYTPGQFYGTLICLVIVALTGPFSTVLIPIVVVMLIKEKNKILSKRSLLLLVILASGAVQGICMEFIDINPAYRAVAGSPQRFHYLKMITNNIDPLFFLDRFGQIPGCARMILCLLVFIGIVILCFIAYQKVANPRKYVLLYATLLFFAAYVALYWPNESKVLALHNTGRYHFIPYTCIGWVFILAYHKAEKAWHRLAYIVFFVLQIKYVRFILPPDHWQEQVKEYYEGKRTVIDIQPDGWRVVLPKR